MLLFKKNLSSILYPSSSVFGLLSTFERTKLYDICFFLFLYNNINLMNQLAVAIISIIVITSASFLVQTILSKSLLYGLIFRMCVFVFQHIYFYVFFLLWQCIETISWKNCMILFLLMNLGNFFVFGFAEIYLARQPRTDIRF